MKALILGKAFFITFSTKKISAKNADMRNTLRQKFMLYNFTVSTKWGSNLIRYLLLKCVCRSIKFNKHDRERAPES